MRKTMFFCLIYLMLSGLTGCTVKNVSRGQAEGEAYDAVISIKGNGTGTKKSADADIHTEVLGETGSEAKALPVEPEDEAAMKQLRGQLIALTELVGEDDETAAGLLGGGEENRTEDEAVLVGRNYRTELFGQECSVYTSYDEAALVSMVVAELPGENAADYEKLLSNLFGEATASDDAETEEKSWYWENGGYRFTLYESDGAVSLDVNWAFFQ